MGTRENMSSSKPAKTSPPQELPGTPSYADWAAAFQAWPTAQYPGYFPPQAVVSSPPPTTPYMWGHQPMVSPYGTPTHPAHPAMYSYGGMYAHPALTMGMQTYSPYGAAPPCTELVMAVPSTDNEPKLQEVKEQAAIKRSKGSIGSSGMMTGTRNDEAAKGTSSSANVHSHSAESGTEHSSEASEDEFTLNGREATSRASLDKISANGHGGANASKTSTKKQAQGPATNLNIGMEYWSSSTQSTAKGKRNSTDATTGFITGGASLQPLVQASDKVGATPWMQDEKELKRQRRKQSNRESARRSRMRKQAECDELSARVDCLTAENSALRSELDRLSQECKNLFADNAALLKKVQICGQDSTELHGERQGVAGSDQIKADGSFGSKGRPSYKAKGSQRMTELFDSGTPVLPTRGHSDVVAAG